MKPEPRRAVPLAKQLEASKRSTWKAMSADEARSYVLERVLAGERQVDIAERFGVSISIVNLRFMEAYRRSSYHETHPYLAKRSRATSERFWDFVIPEPNSGCWIYFGGDNGHSYGSYTEQGGRTRKYAHRLAYEFVKGPISEGLELDHTCNTRCCCNPDHLEPVTRQVNHSRAIERGASFDSNSRKTHCPSGHPLSGPNLIIKNRRNGRTYRACRECERAAVRKYDAQRRGRR